MKNVWHIFRKEALELVRDKRTFYSAVVGPAFLIFLMLYSLSFVESSFSAKASQKLHVVRGAPSNALLDSLKKIEEIQIIELSSAEAGRKLLENGTARVVLEFAPKRPNDPIRVRALFDPDEIKAKVLVATIEGKAAELAAKRINALLDKASVPLADRIPAVVEKSPISKSKPEGASALAGFLPYLIVIWAFYGAFGIASESVAAEKEKQTLETLLITPVRRNEIAIGKFLSLFTIALISCGVSIASIAVIGPTMSSKSMFGSGLQLSLFGSLAMFAAIVPLCAMFAGILLAVSAFAKNVRECQTLLTLISFVVLIPAMFSQFIGFTDFSRAHWIGWIPVLNTATVIRQALLDKVEMPMLGATVLVSIVLAAASIAMAVRMFQRERILARM